MAGLKKPWNESIIPYNLSATFADKLYANLKTILSDDKNPVLKWNLAGILNSRILGFLHACRMVVSVVRTCSSTILLMVSSRLL